MLGDGNIKNFHARAKERRTHVGINCLVTKENKKVLSPEGIKNEFLDYFQKLLAVPSNCTNIFEEVVKLGPLLPREFHAPLVTPISLEECKLVIFSMAASKAPEPDGLTAVFFQRHWELIKHDVLNAITHCLHQKVLPKAFAATTIHLILKSRHAILLLIIDLNLVAMSFIKCCLKCWLLDFSQYCRLLLTPVKGVLSKEGVLLIMC